MKVQCSVCEAAEATVVCCADEAALCKSCDAQVHDANKLASKHQRVPLQTPSKPTRCDICQEKNAYFFCLEDRALLCHGCDMSIHLSNTSTSGHRRFLVTGVTASLHTITSSSNVSTTVAEVSPSTPSKPSRLSKVTPQRNASEKTSAKQLRNSPLNNSSTASTSSFSTSSSGNVDITPTTVESTSILEFLTESVPGWKFDDLLNINPCNSNSTFQAAAAKAHFHMDGDRAFNFEDYSRPVPEMTAAKNSMSNNSASNMNMGLPAFVSSTKMAPTAYCIDDSSLVPDLGIRSPPEVILPSVKKRRTCINNVYYHHQQQQYNSLL